jgi:putative nucleotidyltransferase with HDIG domain
MVASNSTKHYLDSVAKLPLAPTLVTELLALFRDPDKDIGRVVELISYEPSLTVAILRNCNSVYFAGKEPPSDIFEAVTRLGFYEVYTLVTAMFGSNMRSLEGADKGVKIHELWKHSVAVAVCASLIAEQAGENKAVAFTAGLLHEIGKLVLASVERERYGQLLETARVQGVGFIQAEQFALETDHAELGGALMLQWNLPSEIVNAVRFHHDISAAQPSAPLNAVIQMADVIAYRVCGEELIDTDLFPLSATAASQLEWCSAEGASLISEAEKEMERVKKMLQI